MDKLHLFVDTYMYVHVYIITHLIVILVLQPVRFWWHKNKIRLKLLGNILHITLNTNIESLVLFTSCIIFLFQIKIKTQRLVVKKTALRGFNRRSCRKRRAGPMDPLLTK